MVKSDRDDIYADPAGRVEAFRFDARVAAVFPDMIRRSVPGYETILPFISLFADRYARADTRCYDLGCSLGAATLAIRHGVGRRACRIIAVDSSEAMLARAREWIAADDAPAPVAFRRADLRDVAIENASVVVLNFTLQFVPPSERLAALTRIHAGMVPGGVLILSEKIAFEDAAEAVFTEAMHRAFKRAHGYSELEIARKRAALEEVLVPETLAAHHARLAEAGFAESHTWHRCLNFASIAAVA